MGTCSGAAENVQRLPGNQDEPKIRLFRTFEQNQKDKSFLQSPNKYNILKINIQRVVINFKQPAVSCCVIKIPRVSGESFLREEACVATLLFLFDFLFFLFLLLLFVL